MKLAFVINEVASERANYTTTRLAWRAVNAGHEVALIELGDFVYTSSGSVRGLATRPNHDEYRSDEDFLTDVQQRDAVREVIAVDEHDVLMLRSNPADEVNSRHWAATSDLLRPRTCITRHSDEIMRFIDGQGGRAVIKPLQGSGGHGVFVVRPEDRGNLHQMIEAVARDGYVLVQEFLPQVTKSDKRLIMLNGRALCVDGTWACFQRRSSDGDNRTNVTAGGTLQLAQPDESDLRIAELVGPKLKRDGMHLAGLDLAGDRLMEINVHTTGGVSSADDLTGVSFSDYILEDLERKVRLRNHYRGTIDNTTLSVA